MSAGDQEIIDTIAGAMRRRVRYPTDEATRHNARAVLSALRERYAIVELPASSPGWWNCYEDDGDPPDHIVHGEECDEYVVTTWFEHSSEVQISHQGEPMEPISPSAARRFAAALLAAADAAEEGQ